MNFEPLLTLPGRAAFGMYWADPPRPPRQELRPVVGESSCRGGAKCPSPRASRPLACQKSRAAHLHARHTRAMHACIPSPPPTATPAAPDAPRTRISLLPAALLNASRNHPPALMPRAAPPWRQTMNLESIVAYVSRFDGWCREQHKVTFFRGSSFWSRAVPYGGRRIAYGEPRGPRAARTSDFFVFLRRRVLV